MNYTPRFIVSRTPFASFREHKLFNILTFIYFPLFFFFLQPPALWGMVLCTFQRREMLWRACFLATRTARAQHSRVRAPMVTQVGIPRQVVTKVCVGK